MMPVTLWIYYIYYNTFLKVVADSTTPLSTVQPFKLLLVQIKSSLTKCCGAATPPSLKKIKM